MVQHGKEVIFEEGGDKFSSWARSTHTHTHTRYVSSGFMCFYGNRKHKFLGPSNNLKTSSFLARPNAITRPFWGDPPLSGKMLFLETSPSESARFLTDQWGERLEKSREKHWTLKQVNSVCAPFSCIFGQNRHYVGAKNWTQTLFFSNFSGTAGISQQNPGISRQKSLISLVSRDIPNFLAPAPSCGRPLPHWKISGLKSLGLGSFSVADFAARARTGKRILSAPKALLN